MKPCRRRFFLFAPLFIAAFLGLFTSIVYWLWNSVLVDVLSVRAITFWQALGILVLAKVLFGGFPRRRGFGPPWRRRMMERWESLTPDQREQMREEMRRRFGDWPRPCGGGEDEKRAAT